MKAIIYGLLYDTEKSELLHYDNQTLESIYMTKNKRLFITECNDRRIRETNLELCKEYLGRVNPNKYIELLGEVPEA